MERLLAAVGPDVLVVLDEAYHEFQTDTDAVNGMDLIDAHPNLVVLHTFSKAWRLAALRVGYAVGSVAVAAALRKVRTPFSVNAAGGRRRPPRQRRRDARDVRRGGHRAGPGAGSAGGGGLRRGAFARATSCGYRWAAVPRISPTIAATTRWWCARSATRASASRCRRPRRTTRSWPPRNYGALFLGDRPDHRPLRSGGTGPHLRRATGRGDRRGAVGGGRAADPGVAGPAWHARAGADVTRRRGRRAAVGRRRPGLNRIRNVAAPRCPNGGRRRSPRLRAGSW